MKAKTWIILWQILLIMDAMLFGVMLYMPKDISIIISMVSGVILMIVCSYNTWFNIDRMKEE